MFIGVIGAAKDEKGQPLKKAVVKIEGFNDEIAVTPNEAVFKIFLPVGKHRLIVSFCCTLSKVSRMGSFK